MKTPSWSELHEAIQANPNKATHLGHGPATSSLTSLPNDVPIPWLSGWSEDQTVPLPDSIAVSLWLRDPLYRSATDSVRGLMEMEEAAALLHSIDDAWKVHSGRWVRKHLEEELRSRAAGAAPAPDAWDAVRQQKRVAQLVDYVCIQRGFRLALWSTDKNQKTVTTIPAQANTDFLLMIMADTNRALLGPEIQKLPLAEFPAIILKADAEWMLPACAPSLGATTVASIIEQLQAIRPGTYKGNRNTLWKLLQYERAIATTLVE